LLYNQCSECNPDETQPQGTKATIVGKNVAGPDIIYEDANGAL